MTTSGIQTILPYKTLSKDIQVDIANTLWEMWAEDYKATNINSATQLVEKFNDIFACFVMFDGFDWVGCATINIDTPIEMFKTQYWIGNLFIKKDVRKKRYGTMMIKYAEKYLKSRNISLLYIWCYKDVIGFYLKNNWNLSHSEAHPHKEDTHIMIKMI